jgi:tRNA-guanine family transglycosylase
MNKRTMPASRVDALLVNVPEVRKSKSGLENTKSMIGRAHARYAMLDSGGFQILTAQEKGKRLTHDASRPLVLNKRELNIAPEHVLEAASELKPNLVICLDNPIRKLKGVEQQREFENKFDMNVEWAVRTSLLIHEYRVDPESLLIPVQCYTLHQFDLFYGMLTGLEFGGLSMPTRNMSIEKLASFLRSMRQKEVRRVHVLGTTTAEAISLCAFLARHYFDWLSLDATTWRRSAENQLYQNPLNLRSKDTRLDSFAYGQSRNNCPCPWCHYSSYLEISSMEYGDKFRFLCSHNFWVIRNFAELAYQHAIDLTIFATFLDSRLEAGHVSSIVDNLTLFDSRIETSTLAS